MSKHGRNHLVEMDEIEAADESLVSLEAGAARLGVPLDPDVKMAFITLLGLLQKATVTLNLTSIRDSDGIVRRHFLESLALGARLQERDLLEPGRRVLDLGSGAGFPGLPIKLAWPGLEVDLLEATLKKAAFLRDAVRALALDRTGVLADRAETLAHSPQRRESYDIVLARAVAALPALVELALPFLRTGGVLAAVKGAGIDDELAAATRALQLCGGTISELIPPSGEESPSVILIEKHAPTPAQYPRHPGQPVRHPLRNRA